MALGDPLDDAAGGLRDFEAALAAATDALGGISGGGSGEGDASVGGGGRGGGGKKSRGRRGALGGAALGAAALGAANDFAQGFGATGDVGVGIGTARRGLNSFVARIPIAGGLLGFTQQEKILSRTESRVSALLSNDARYGMLITDKEIQQQIDIVRPQEEKAAGVEARIKGRTGASENLGDAGKSDALIEAFEKMFTVLDRISNTIEGITGGSNR